MGVHRCFSPQPSCVLPVACSMDMTEVQQPTCSLKKQQNAKMLNCVTTYSIYMFVDTCQLNIAARFALSFRTGSKLERFTVHKVGCVSLLAKLYASRTPLLKPSRLECRRSLE